MVCICMGYMLLFKIIIFINIIIIIIIQTTDMAQEDLWW